MQQWPEGEYQQRTECKKERCHFILRSLLFILPIVLLTAPAILVMTGSGEALRDLDHVIVRLSKQKYLIGFAYNEQNYPYLKRSTLIVGRNAEVLALGSSRVLSFREQMFHRPFYNAGYTIQKAGDFRRFLASLPPTTKPSVLIVGLDQWMFNTSWCANAGATSDKKWTVNPSVDVRSAVRRIPEIYSDAVRGRISVWAVLRRSQTSDGISYFGLNAVVNHKGFRNDGSFDYGRQVDELVHHRVEDSNFGFSQTLSRVASGRDRFQFGNTPDPFAIEEIRQLLEFCRDRKIYVIAFLPPFADCVYKAMKESGQHTYLSKLSRTLEPILRTEDSEFYDFSDMKSCGSSDEEAVDGFHAGEVAYLRMLQLMAMRGSRLSDYCDSEQLARDLKSAVNRYEVYPN